MKIEEIEIETDEDGNGIAEFGMRNCEELQIVFKELPDQKVEWWINYYGWPRNKLTASISIFKQEVGKIIELVDKYNEHMEQLSWLLEAEDKSAALLTKMKEYNTGHPERIRLVSSQTGIDTRTLWDVFKKIDDLEGVQWVMRKPKQ